MEYVRSGTGDLSPPVRRESTGVAFFDCVHLIWPLARSAATRLDLFGLRKVGGLAGAEQGPFHASGHIDGPGMQLVIETIKPARILPVHTQKLGWFETRWPEKVVRAPYGEAMGFD